MSYTTEGDYDPFLYMDGTMYDLLDLLIPIPDLTSLQFADYSSGIINDVGQIAAYGMIGGQTHALRLDPVPTPEPTTAALLLGSTALLALRRRRSLMSSSTY